MKVLLLEKTLDDAADLTTKLKEGGHTPIGVVDEIGLKQAVTAQLPHVALVGMKANAAGALDGLRQLRGTKAKLTSILLVKGHDEAFLTSAFDAGLDLDLQVPITAPYLMTRLRVLERHAGLPPAKPLTSVPAASAKGKPGEATFSYASCRAWREASTILATAGGSFLSIPTSVSDAQTMSAPFDVAARITLSSVEHQIELQLTIATDRVSARDLVVHQFGEDDPGLFGDLVGEMANIFMGALKTAFNTEHLPVTGSLPAAIEPREVLATGVTFKHQEAFILCLGAAHVFVHLGLRSKANVFLLPTALNEGMVLAKDLFNARGMMLLNGGTRLSLGMVEKIRGSVGPQTQVEVMAP